MALKEIKKAEKNTLDLPAGKAFSALFLPQGHTSAVKAFIMIFPAVFEAS